MQSLFIVHSYFFARTNIAERKEHYVPIDRPHIRVRFARMIDVMGPVAAATAIDAKNLRALSSNFECADLPAL